MMARNYTQKLRHCDHCGISTTQNYARKEGGKSLDLAWQCLHCGKYTSNDDPPQDVT